MPRKTDALKHFKRVDPHFYYATALHHGSLPTMLSVKRTRRHLFEALVSIVIAQQLGIAAADTIFERVKSACKGSLTSLLIVKIKPEALRKAGLSAAKIKTIQAIARAIENGSLDLLSLKRLTKTEVSEKLLQIWGLGPWSVEMFLMNSLGRADVFSPGDLGLVRAMETIYDLSKNTPRTSLLAISEKWSPYRSYACLLLWRFKDTKAG